MAAATTDKLRKVARRWVGQIGSGGVADDTVTTIPLSSSTNLPTGTAVSVVIDRVDANGTETPTLEETSIGIVSSTNLVSCVRGEEGTAQAHDAGAVVEVLLTSNMWNDMVDWGVVEHSQLGVHATATVTTLKATGAEINTGTEDGKIVTPKAIADSDIPSGLTPARETWAYASATTITIPAGGLLKYAVGDKIKLTQTTVKYFYVVTVADELLTVTGGSDYTVANAAITSPFYSHASTPIGFPLMAHTPVVTSSVGAITTVSSATSTFQIVGTRIVWKGKINITDIGTGAGVLYVSAPIDPNPNYYHTVVGYNVSAAFALTGRISAANGAEIRKYDGTFPMAAETIIFEVTYEF